MDKLKSLYYDPENGFVGIHQLYKLSKEHNLNLTFKQVQQWYNDQTTNQVYKQPPKQIKYNKIVAPYFEIGCFQADLMDFSRFYKQNKGYKYLCNIIDIYSRYAYSFPIKTKKPDEILPYIKMIVQTIKDKSKHIIFTFDNGGEFEGVVKKYLNDNKIKIYLNDPSANNQHHQMAIIERFNKTLLGKIKKYMNAFDTLTYIDVLHKLIKNYNNTVHSSTMKKPIDIFLNDDPPVIRVDVSKLVDKFKIGDVVRYKKKMKVFDKKGFLPTYSLQTHKIVSVYKNRYILDNNKTFYEDELIKGTGVNAEFKKKMKENQREMKSERLNKIDFKMPIEQIENQIIGTKRNRKQTKYFINN